MFATGGTVMLPAQPARIVATASSPSSCPRAGAPGGRRGGCPSRRDARADGSPDRVSGRRGRLHAAHGSPHAPARVPADAARRSATRTAPSGRSWCAPTRRRGSRSSRIARDRTRSRTGRSRSAATPRGRSCRPSPAPARRPPPSLARALKAARVRADTRVMTSALPIPTRMLVIVGVAIAALAALFVARPLLLDDSGSRRHSGGRDPRPHRPRSLPRHPPPSPRSRRSCCCRACRRSSRTGFGTPRSS